MDDFGYEWRCGYSACPHSSCDGCPASAALDEAGIGKASGWDQVGEVMDSYAEKRKAGAIAWSTS